MNNFGRIARSTDYYVCDIEYRHEKKQFDLVAVYWPSEPKERKEAKDRQLVFIEMKYGDNALEGSSGVYSHIKDVNQFLLQREDVKAFKKDMVDVFNQKRFLGLVDCGKDLESFSDERPVLLLVLADHDPGSSKLREILDALPDSPHAELRIATASFMGYGLYQQGIHTIDETRKHFEDYIHSS